MIICFFRSVKNISATPTSIVSVDHQYFRLKLALESEYGASETGKKEIILRRVMLYVPILTYLLYHCTVS